MATKKRYDSGADSVLMNDEDYALTQKYKQDFASAQQAGNQAGMDAAHDAVEALRAKYNYSGGADGSDYISLGNKNHSSTATKPSRVDSMEEFSYESAPTWTSKYQEQIDALTQEILNRPDFSYDPESDPRYQAFRKEYQREGQRATADTLGQMAVMTGGMPSTAAATAAQQAGDYYAAQMADRIPELYQLAYDMYRAEGDELRANLDMLDALESGDYNRYLNLLNQYNTDRNFAYGVYGDTWNRNYQMDRDDVDDTRYDMEWNYGVDRDEVSDQRYQDELAYSRNLDRAQTLAAAGDFSGYKALGYSDAEIKAMQDAYNREQAAARLSSSGGSRSGSTGGGNSGGSSGSTGGVYQRMYDEGIRSYDDAYEWLRANGYGTTDANRYANGLVNKIEAGDFSGAGEEALRVDMSSVLDLGYGPIDETSLEDLIERGEVEEYVEDGVVKFRRTGRQAGGSSPLAGGFGLLGR